MQYDLFISHSSADAATARALVTDFENRGITCWLAPRDIPMGSSYQNEIVSAIDRCRAVLLLFSDAANRSEHVLREVELAAQGRKPIYPLRIDASEPAGGLKYMLANKQWVERKALGNRLVETIERLLASNPEVARPLGVRPAAPPAPPPPSKRPLMIGAVALALCVLLGGGLYAWKAEQDRQETARVEQAARQKEAQEKAAQEKAAQERAAQEKAAQERAAQERAAQERAAQERAAQERAAQERAAQERAAQERAAQEKAAQEAAQEKAAQEKAAQERAAQEKAAQERAAQEQAEKAAAGIARGAPSRRQVFAGKPYLFQECDVCPVMAAIPAGSNMIGSPDSEINRERNEGPQQEITIRTAFAVGRSEVSFAEWLACVAEGGCNSFKPGDRGWGYGQRPAIFVSWADARAYAAWLSNKTGAEYRLLSEAEWEYAARGCATICRSTPFWFGMDISKQRANYNSRYSYEDSPKAIPLGRTAEVMDSEPNRFGLAHVHGNVAEWVADCWNPTLDSHAEGWLAPHVGRLPEPRRARRLLERSPEGSALGRAVLDADDGPHRAGGLSRRPHTFAIVDPRSRKFVQLRILPIH